MFWRPKTAFVVQPPTVWTSLAAPLLYLLANCNYIWLTVEQAPACAYRSLYSITMISIVILN